MRVQPSSTKFFGLTYSLQCFDFFAGQATSGRYAYVPVPQIVSRSASRPMDDTHGEAAKPTAGISG